MSTICASNVMPLDLKKKPTANPGHSKPHAVGLFFGEKNLPGPGFRNEKIFSARG